MIAGAGMGDVSDVIGDLVQGVGGQVDQVADQVATIKTELKIALAASYVAGALALVAIIRRI